MKPDWYQIIKYDYYLLNFIVALIVCLILTIIPLFTGFFYLPGKIYRKHFIITNSAQISLLSTITIVFGLILFFLIIYRICSISQRFKYGIRIKADIIPNKSWPTIIKYRYLYNSTEYQAFCRIMNTNIIENGKSSINYDIYKKPIINKIEIVVNRNNPKKTYLFEPFIRSEI